jgi:hypothetical protein
VHPTGVSVLPPLPPRDIDSLLSVWPRALTCPAWRLRGESPSPGLFGEIRSGAAHEQVLRGDADVALGLLQIGEVDTTTASASLGFLLPPTGDAAAIVQQFLVDTLARLELRRITVHLDDDVLDVLSGTPLPLRNTGRLRGHTRVGVGRYVDRHIFEFTGEVAVP